MKDYAELEKRLRAEGIAECDEAADAISELTKRCEALTEGMTIASERVERLAFQMPPPNDWTPQFVVLAQSMRIYVHEQVLLSRELLQDEHSERVAEPGAEPEQ